MVVVVVVVAVVVMVVPMAAVAARAFSAEAAVAVAVTATFAATHRASRLVRVGVEGAAARRVAGRTRRRRQRRGGSGLEGAFSLALAWAVPAGVASAVAAGRELWAPLVYLLGPSQSRHVGSRGMQAEGERLRRRAGVRAVAVAGKAPWAERHGELDGTA